MEKERYLIKILLICFMNTIILGCSQTNEQRMLDEAVFEFDNAMFEDRISVEFEGPVVKGRIGNFEKDDRIKVYGWWYLYKNDSIWVYVEVDKLKSNKANAHFSKEYIDNIGELKK